MIVICVPDMPSSLVIRPGRIAVTQFNESQNPVIRMNTWKKFRRFSPLNRSLTGLPPPLAWNSSDSRTLRR